MTNKDLESQLQSLRSKIIITKVLTSCSSAAMIPRFITGLVPMAIFSIVLRGGRGFQIEKNNSELKRLLGNDVVSGTPKETLGDTVEYSPWDRIDPDNMVFPFTCNRTDGSNHIKAIYHRLKIELGDIELINESELIGEDARAEKQDTTFLKGQ